MVLVACHGFGNVSQSWYLLQSHLPYVLLLCE